MPEQDWKWWARSRLTWGTVAVRDWSGGSGCSVIKSSDAIPSGGGKWGKKGRD